MTHDNYRNKIFQHSQNIQFMELPEYKAMESQLLKLLLEKKNALTHKMNDKMELRKTPKSPERDDKISVINQKITLLEKEIDSHEHGYNDFSDALKKNKGIFPDFLLLQQEYSFTSATCQRSTLGVVTHYLMNEYFKYLETNPTTLDAQDNFLNTIMKCYETLNNAARSAFRCTQNDVSTIPLEEARAYVSNYKFFDMKKPTDKDNISTYFSVFIAALAPTLNILEVVQQQTPGWLKEMAGFKQLAEKDLEELHTPFELSLSTLKAAIYDLVNQISESDELKAIITTDTIKSLEDCLEKVNSLTLNK